VRAGYAQHGEGRSVSRNDTLTMVLKSAKVSETDGERVFGNQRGQPYRSSRTAFERAIRWAGIVAFTFHALRYIVARTLVTVGVDLPTTQELRGGIRVAR
jgi:hypothetical protein